MAASVATSSSSSLVLERVEAGEPPSAPATRVKPSRAEAAGSKQQKAKQKNKLPTFNQKGSAGHDNYPTLWGNVRISVADPDPGSGAFLNPGPGSGILNRFFPDPGSQTHIFESLVTNFWVKSSIIFEKWPKKFLHHFKNK